MKRLLLLLLASAVVPCASASAQITNPDVITGVKIDGKNPEANTFFINADMCEEDVKIEVNLAGLNEPPFLEVWRTNSSESCHTAGGRTVGTAGGAAACSQIGEARQTPGSSLTLTFTAKELFADDGNECDQSGSVKVYFVPVDNETPAEATAGVAEGRGEPAWITFTVDFDPPSKPTSVKGLPGENQIRVTWKSDETSNTSDGFTIYYDPNGISKIGEECVSANLMEGMAPKDTATLESSSEGAGSTSTTKSPGSLGLETGEQIPVAVVAKDQAGNRSELSEVICVGRIETDGFYDRYMDSGSGGLEKCSMQAPGRASLTGLGSLTLLAFALVARRRRAT